MRLFDRFMLCWLGWGTVGGSWCVKPWLQEISRKHQKDDPGRYSPGISCLSVLKSSIFESVPSEREISKQLSCGAHENKDMALFSSGSWPDSLGGGGVLRETAKRIVLEFRIRWWVWSKVELTKRGVTNREEQAPKNTFGQSNKLPCKEKSISVMGALWLETLLLCMITRTVGYQYSHSFSSDFCASYEGLIIIWRAREGEVETGWRKWWTSGIEKLCGGLISINTDNDCISQNNQQIMMPTGKLVAKKGAGTKGFIQADMHASKHAARSVQGQFPVAKEPKLLVCVLCVDFFPMEDIPVMENLHKKERCTLWTLSMKTDAGSATVEVGISGFRLSVWPQSRELVSLFFTGPLFMMWKAAESFSASSCRRSFSTAVKIVTVWNPQRIFTCWVSINMENTLRLFQVRCHYWNVNVQVYFNFCVERGNWFSST